MNDKDKMIQALITELEHREKQLLMLANAITNITLYNERALGVIENDVITAKTPTKLKEVIQKLTVQALRIQDTIETIK